MSCKAVKRLLFLSPGLVSKHLLDACFGRCEALQLQSQLSDAQDEAQLLRRLLTLCNQALSDVDRDGQSMLANIQEEQQMEDKLQRDTSEHGAAHQVCPQNQHSS